MAKPEFLDLIVNGLNRPSNAYKFIRRFGVHRTLRLMRMYYHHKKQSLELPYYPELQIEPSNACNLRCRMCTQSIFGDKKNGHMNMELYNDIINKAKGNVLSVLLTLSGEPLVHKNIIDMIKIAKNAGMYVSMHTNATLLTQSKGKEILESELDELHISFDGENGKETYEKIRVRANYDVTLKNIKDFLTLRKEMSLRKPHVSIQYIRFYGLNGTDIDHNKNFESLFNGLNVDKFDVVFAHVWGTEQIGKSDNFEYKEPPHSNNYFPCFQLWHQMTIGWNGKVNLCCIDLEQDYDMGDISKQSIKEIWNGEKMIEMRKKLVNKDIENLKLCKNCINIWH